MDSRIKKLQTLKACQNFEANADRLGHPNLARQARQRAIQIRAGSFGAKTDAEREAVEAVYAYEAVLSAKKKKTIKASRTWQMVKRHGILEAVERAVKRTDVTMGFTHLVEMGLENHAFEAVILRHPDHFSDEAISISKSRMDELGVN